MAVNRGLFVRATGTAPSKVGTTPIESRLALAAMVAAHAPGVPRPGIMANGTLADIVTSNAGSMAYSVAPFEAVLVRAAGEGVYIMTASGTTSVGTDPAPATNSRWDIVYVKQNDVDKGDPDNLPVIDVAKGTAAASPTKPTIPNGAMALAEARIYAGTTGTSGGSNTITALHQWTAGRNATVPVRTLADRQQFTAPSPGQQVVRLDRANFVQTYVGPTTNAATPSGWEWTSPPKRYYADTMAWSGTSNANSKVIYTMTEQGTWSFATKMRVNARMHVSSSTISAGILAISVNASLLVGQVQDAQDKARMSFVPPGGYWQTAATETDWIAIGAGAQPLPRIWIEYITGTVNTASGATSVYGHMWVEVLPADD